MTPLNSTCVKSIIIGLAISCCGINLAFAFCSIQQAKDTIAAAKMANEQAKLVDNGWRDTAKIITNAEKALSSGDCEKAIELANQALKQAENAIAQAAQGQQPLPPSRPIKPSGIVNRSSVVTRPPGHIFGRMVPHLKSNCTIQMAQGAINTANSLKLKIISVNAANHALAEISNNVNSANQALLLANSDVIRDPQNPLVRGLCFQNRSRACDDCYQALKFANLARQEALAALAQAQRMERFSNTQSVRPLTLHLRNKTKQPKTNAISKKRLTVQPLEHRTVRTNK